ncbi:hypothetical protein UCMB321_2185 [Pseudomonas batumici]|uniref:Uncharacterized protein n=1 Tax=Pseudomonas batumici TaxID=226910 RepID=A0A0C2I4C7_9PSED|nr:hypothetical protein UCMB321_2185 [Pseudomonas batumici]
MGLAEAFQALAQHRVDLHRYVAATVTLHRRAGAVGGQGQQRRGTAQVAAPEVGLLGQAFAGEGPALPRGVVGILDRQGRQRVGLVLAEGLVKSGELLDQHPHRPAVGDDVVLGDQQDVLVIGQAQQTPTNQRTLAQVEGRRGFAVADTRGAEAGLFVGQRAQVLLGQGETAVGRGDDLHRLLAVAFEGGAQAFMTRHQAVERGLERVPVEIAAQQQRHRHVVGTAGAGIELVEEPQALLGEGQRQRRAALDRLDAVGLRRLQAADHPRQFGHGRMAEELAQHHLAAQLLAHPGNQLRGQQGVAAEFEETVVTAHPLKPQQFLEDLRQGLFGGAFGGGVAALGHGVQVRSRQRVLVQLAVAGQRVGREGHKGAGDHVVGQGGAQLLAQGRHFQADRGLGDQVGNQALALAGVIAGQHAGFAHAVTGQQLGLDFPQFDTETTDLHLGVHPAQVDDLAVVQQFAQVAGAVQALAGTQRVGDETFGAQLRAVQVTTADTQAADADFPGHADWQQALLGVEDIGHGGRDRPANVGDTGGDIRGIDGLVGHVHAGFGDAVHVDQRHMAEGLMEGVELAQLQAFTAEDHIAQAFQAHIAAGQGSSAELQEGRRGLVEHRDLLAFEEAQQLRRIATQGFGHQGQAAAVEQGAVHLPDREVEGVGVEQRPDVLGVEGKLRAIVVHQPHDVAVFQQCALGFAGGTRGVDHIAEMIRGVDVRQVGRTLGIVARRFGRLGGEDLDAERQQRRAHVLAGDGLACTAVAKHIGDTLSR